MAATEAQQPEWPDPDELRAAVATLTGLPPLVFPRECDVLTRRLAAVARGDAFVVQGGDCAETFAAATVEQVRNKLTTLLQMALVLTYGTGLPVVRIGRIAGQFAKPRSRPTEVRAGVELPAYRGDAVNDVAFTPQARTADPRRMLRAYSCSAATLELCRTVIADGCADLRQVHTSNQVFVRASPARQRYAAVATEIDRAMRFMRAHGVDPAVLWPVELFTSHEALLLDYEQALTRPDPTTGRLYDLSAHFLWIGERTHAPDGAHVAFTRWIRNPIGVKLGPTTTRDEALTLVDTLDPSREPGRLSMITRMNAGRIRDALPPLVEAVTASGAQVAWICDPMHGNTVQARRGHKTRYFDDVVDEVAGFFEVHRALGTHPGGLHLELTGDDVTECVGGSHPIGEQDLGGRYETACDPRLNRSQSLDLAFLAAELYRDSR